MTLWITLFSDGTGPADRRSRWFRPFIGRAVASRLRPLLEVTRRSPSPLIVAVTLGLAGCGDIPYRTLGFSAASDCRALYNLYDDLSNSSVSAEVRASPCWKRAIEERDEYDLLIAEFDDQGWVQGTSDQKRPAKDHLDQFFERLKAIYEDNRRNGLSIAVFVHGWHNNADAENGNVRDFRKFLRDLAIAESGRKIGEAVRAGTGPRVVGIYLGWRGESITLRYINAVTFWERKNTAERVAQGSIREFFERMDFLRDRGRTNVPFDSLSTRDCKGDGTRNVRMLTIGHSFGGLITFEALSSGFVRSAARSLGEDYVSRLGDLVVIVNPAVEGARYEALMVAAQRMRDVKKDQLPVSIVATSTADWATGWAFPLARRVSTLLESTPGQEGDAIVKAVGHNERYTTHLLDLCPAGNAACANACPSPDVMAAESKEGVRLTKEEIFRSRKPVIDAEFALMKGIGDRGFATTENLCGGLQLKSTANQMPAQNPFWVVSTSGEIMKGHNDIFNPHFESFIRQMYLGVIAVRMKQREEPTTECKR